MVAPNPQVADLDTRGDPLWERGRPGRLRLDGPQDRERRAPRTEDDTRAEIDARTGPSDSFRALCDDLLGARVAYLCPVGPLASLVGGPLTVPETAAPPSGEALASLVAQIGDSRLL